MSCERVSEWFASVGLDMYSDLVAQNLLTGEALAGIISRQGNAELVVRTYVSKKVYLSSLIELT